MALTTKIPAKYEDLDKSKRNKIETIVENLNNGACLQDACKTSDMSAVTFYRYRQRYTWIQEALDVVRAARLHVVEDSLYRSAIGYDYETTDQTMEDEVDAKGNRVGGQKRRMHKKTVHVPMVPVAAIFYLKNRSRGEWRSDQYIKIESSHTERTELALTAEVRSIVQNASTEDLRTLSSMGARLVEEVKARSRAKQIDG